MTRPACIGNQTAFSAASWRDPFDFAARHGLRAFEWFEDSRDGHGFEAGLIDELQAEQLRTRAAQAGIRFSVHAPWRADLRTQDGLNLALRSVELARRVGAEVLVVHIYAEPTIGRFAANLRPLAETAAQAGVGIAIENTVETGPAELEQIARCVNDLCSQGRVGLCLDVGHANLHEPFRNRYLDYIAAIPPALPVMHVHLHENFGDRDAHLTPFTGPSAQDPSGMANLVSFLAGRGFDGLVIMETWPQPADLLLYAATRFREVASQHGLAVV